MAEINLNVVAVTGRLTRDPELKYTQSGKAVLNFTIAVNNGQAGAYFFNVQAWEKTAEAVANYTHKGSKVAVNGRLSSRNYEAKDGTNRTIVEIIANQYAGIEFLDAREPNEHQEGNYTSQRENGLERNTSANSVNDVNDDDLPF